jgi:hypothetical protein
VPNLKSVVGTLLDVGLVFYNAGYRTGEVVYDLTHPEPEWGPCEDPVQEEDEEEDEASTPDGVDEDGDFYPA